MSSIKNRNCSFSEEATEIYRGQNHEDILECVKYLYVHGDIYIFKQSKLHI